MPATATNPAATAATPSYTVTRLLGGYDVTRLGVPGPDAVITAGLPSETTPLATIALTILRDAGGEYATLDDAESFVTEFLGRCKVDRVCAVTIRGSAIDRWRLLRVAQQARAERPDA